MFIPDDETSTSIAQVDNTIDWMSPDEFLESPMTLIVFGKLIKYFS